MNIEPAILVMHHSIKPHPAITATLLDFLCRIITNFYPKEQDKVRNGIYSSLRQILEKRVLPSLSPLFDNPRLDRELKFLLRERFAPFVDCTKPIDRPSDGLAILDDPVDSETVLEPVEDMTGGPEFSDDEIEEVKGNGEGLDNIDGELVGYDSKKAKKKPSAPSRKDPSDSKSSPVKVRKRPVKQNVAGVDTESTILDQNVRRLLVELRSGAGPVADDNLPLRTEEDEEKCEIMDQLIRVIISEDFSYEQCNALALRLSDILRPTFEGKVFPAARDVETLEDSVGKPLFVAFRALCDLADGEGSGILLQVLAELYALQPRVGYYLLYFLSVDKQAKQREPRPKATIYKDLCETIDSNYSLDICLVNDMRQCQEDDVELFVHLVPDVYTIFPKSSIGNVNLLYLVVSCVDGRQIQRLVCHILSKELLLFKKDSFASIVTSSLTWETFEQYAFWQLISAHDVPVDCMVSVLPKLKFENHPEALTATLLRLRSERPSADLMRHVLSRDPSVGDRFVSTCLGYWLFEHEDKLVDLISSYLLKQANSGSSSNSSGSGSSSLKRKRGGATSSSSLPRKAEMALMHLDVLRQNCKQTDFFSHPNLQKALRLSRQLCTDAQKKKFMDLFALAETESDGDEDDDEEVQFTHKPSSSSRKNSATKSSKSNSRGNKRTVQDDDVVSESSESDNSDEEDSKPLSSSGSRSKHRGGGGKATKAVSNPRKRAPSKVSYKEMESSDDSSEDESSSKRKKRRKKIANSDSD
jgi:integrator complex subunit 3